MAKPKKKASDFRYNTGETKVPWAAVGENYNAEDLMAIVRFMMKGEGAEYDAAIQAVEEIIKWGKANGYKFLTLQENSPTSHHDVSN